MIQSDFRWADTAFGGPQHRNHVLPIEEIEESLPEDRTDCFATWHRFSEAYYRHRQETGSTGRYSGPSYADYLPFDFDGDDLATVQVRVQDFLKELELSHEIDGLRGTRCYFSGRRGFHILLSSTLFGSWSPSAELASQLKQVARHIGQHSGVDMAIYDRNRLLRLPNTKHSGSDLWKIPLYAREILTVSVDDIRELAAGPRSLDFPEWDDVEIAESCSSLMKGVAAGKTNDDLPAKGPGLFSRDLREGDGRDNQAFQIARYFRDRNTPRPVVLEILEMWDALQMDPLGKQVLEQKVDSAFTRAPDASSEIGDDDIMTPRELIAEYDAYIEKLKSHKITLGWDEIDGRLRGVAPGEVLIIIAKSGVGKTAALQNILRHVTRAGNASLFCSLEQPLAQVFERYAQMGMKKMGEDIEAAWHQPERRAEISIQIIEDLGDQALTCGRSGLRLAQLEEALSVAESKLGRPVNVLAVDYMGLINMSDQGKDLYGQTSRVARELKNIAKRHDIVIICLCQVSRASGGDGSQRLAIGSARESGAIEESADFLLGLYRPDLHGTDTVINVQILKNRKGQDGVEFQYSFDKKSLRIGNQSCVFVKRNLGS